MLHVNHPEGNLDKLPKIFPDLRLAIAGEPITARLMLATPMSDPSVDMAQKENKFSGCTKVLSLENVQN